MPSGASWDPWRLTSGAVLSVFADHGTCGEMAGDDLAGTYTRPGASTTGGNPVSAAAGPGRNVLTFMPPLVIETEDLDTLCNALEDVLAE